MMREQNISLNLFSLLSTIFVVMLVSAITLWVVAWSYYNSSHLDEVTFSIILATVEEVRIIYAFWLATYVALSFFLTFLTVYEPLLVEEHKERLYTSSPVTWVNYFYIVSVAVQLTGLLFVLLFPVNDPDTVVAHDVSAMFAFGAAIIGSLILLIKRKITSSLHAADFYCCTISSRYIWFFNFIYWLSLFILAIVFVILSFVEDTFEKGYLEFVITIFCVVDRFWQLLDFKKDNLTVVIWEQTEKEQQQPLLHLHKKR